MQHDNLLTHDELFVHAVSVCAPGLPDWPTAASVLRGTAPLRAHPLNVPLPKSLPANEQRRLPRIVRVALHAAECAVAQAAMSMNVRLRAVFACSGGNADALEEVLFALNTPGSPVSPRQFSHMDHNAAAGYWAIGHSATSVSVSIGAYDGSFAAGLLEATAASLDDPRVLLVAFDGPPPPPMQSIRPVKTEFAVAILLGITAPPAARARWRCRVVPEQPEDVCCDPELERLRLHNPAARCLPLLALVASDQTGTVTLPYLSGRCLLVEHAPC